MKQQIENLSLGGKLPVEEALAELSEATGLDDQGLKNRMTLLENHQGTVTFTDVSGANISRIQVALEGSDTTYLIDFHRDKEATIKAMEHDSVEDWKESLGV